MYSVVIIVESTLQAWMIPTKIPLHSGTGKSRSLSWNRSIATKVSRLTIAKVSRLTLAIERFKESDLYRNVIASWDLPLPLRTNSRPRCLLTCISISVILNISMRPCNIRAHYCANCAGPRIFQTNEMPQNGFYWGVWIRMFAYF